MAKFNGDEAVIEGILLESCGFVVALPDVARLLGYPSPSALRQAIYRGLAPVRMFQLPGRRGHYCLASDLARYVASLTAGPPA